MNLNSGMLFAVPIPDECAIESNFMKRIISEALDEAKKNHIEGKEVTPYLLQVVKKLTRGKSLKSSILCY